MELVIDIGNTNVVIGAWNGGWQHVWRIETHSASDAEIFYKHQISLSLLEKGLTNVHIERITISSVVPEITTLIEQTLIDLGFRNVLVLSADHFSSLNIRIDQPHEIGSDLVANAVAAYEQYSSAALVIDFGTALTFTAVSNQGDIEGVAIAPGLRTAMMSLYGKTSKLPEAPIQLPETAIGKNTIHAIQSGVLWGYVGLVQQMISKISEEMNTDMLTIGTGGLSSILHPLKSVIDHYEPNLTLDGIRILGNRISA